VNHDDNMADDKKDGPYKDLFTCSVCPKDVADTRDKV
jgi:hypothetical protein